MEWFTKHADTIVILVSFAMCFWHLNEKMNSEFNKIDKDLAVIKKDLSVIKTVLIMKNICPNEILSTKEEKYK